MVQQQDGLVDNVTSLAERLSHLGQRFSAAAQALEAQGELPSEEILKEVAVVRSDFEQVRTRALNMANAMGIATGTQEIRSLAALQPVFRAIAEAEHEKRDSEQIRQDALAVLSRVLLIRHQDDALFVSLKSCQDVAQALAGVIKSASWTALPTETFLLARKDHAYSDLLALAENHGSLDDERWALLLKKVSDAFDRPLSLAAARGRLIVSGEQSAMDQATSNQTHPNMVRIESGPLEAFHPIQTAPQEKKPRWGGFRFARIALPS